MSFVIDVPGQGPVGADLEMLHDGWGGGCGRREASTWPEKPKSCNLADSAMRFQIVASSLAGLAVVLMLIGMFVPTTSQEETTVVPSQSFGGFGTPSQTVHFVVEMSVWKVFMEANGNQITESWFSSDADDTDGVGALRTAPILMLLGWVAAVVAGGMLWIPKLRMVGTWTLVGAGAFMMAATVTHVLGVDLAHDSSDPEWAAGAILLWIGAAVGVLAAATMPSQKFIALVQANQD